MHAQRSDSDYLILSNIKVLKLRLSPLKVGFERAKTIWVHTIMIDQRSRKIWFFCEFKIFLTRSKHEDMTFKKSKNHRIQARKKLEYLLFSTKKNHRFFDLLEVISSGFKQVRNILSLQKNQILRDLCSCELKLFFARSKPTLNRESPNFRTLIFDKIK